jgi:hypothetical protein
VGLAGLCTFLSCGTKDKTVPPAPRRLVLTFEDAQPTYTPPEGKDRELTPSAYTPLAPSRTDGKPTFSTDWFAGGEFWMEHVGHLKGKPGLRYLEIGVYEGRSFIWVLQNILTDPSSSAVAIDVFFQEGLEERFRENLQRAGVAERVTVLKGYSNVELRSLKLDSFDLIYVDGSHKGGDVLRDAVLSWDLLKVGGIIVFDDYEYTPLFPPDMKPMVALDALISTFREEVEVSFRGYQLILRKKAPACLGSCSTFGPYYYYWYWHQGRERLGDLYDPRTKTRVPLTDEEHVIIEALLRSRPFGHTETVVDEPFLKSERFKRLRKKLGI